MSSPGDQIISSPTTPDLSVSEAELSIAAAAISSSFTTTTNPVAANTGTKPKRQSKCSGCHHFHDNHSWGIPGPACQGPPDVASDLPVETIFLGEPFTTSAASGISPVMSSNVQADSAKQDTQAFSAEKAAIVRRLQELRLEEEKLVAMAELEAMRRKLCEKEAALTRKKELLVTPSQPPTATQAPTTNRPGE